MALDSSFLLMFGQADNPALYPEYVLQGINPISGHSCPAVEIAITNNSGIGVFARCNIAKGDRILCEKPLFTAQYFPPGDMEVILTEKLNAMSSEVTHAFLNLHNNFPTHHLFSGTFKTNALPCGERAPVGAIYTTTSRFNHSCLPNAHASWHPTAEHETVYAMRPIAAGEEITIGYELGGTR